MAELQWFFYVKKIFCDFIGSVGSLEENLG
jgi:hypothetical protein